MTTETLRKAAAVMRERAEAARLWEFEDGSKREIGWHAVDELWGEPFDRAHAEHIASWRPAAAIEVADWLEFVADQHVTLSAAMETGETNLSPTAINNATGMGFALAAARAYLGESER